MYFLKLSKLSFLFSSINQTILLLSEALHFSDCAGLDTANVVEAISQGAAQSWQMDNRSKTMIQGEFDFGFAVDWMRKDLGLVLDAGNRAGASLPLTALSRIG